MIEKDLDIIYNKKYLIIIPDSEKNLFADFEYTLQNTIIMKNSVDDINFFIKFINQNNISKIIFVDYQIEYEEVINNLKKSHEIDFIFTKALGALSDQHIYYMFTSIYKLYKDKIVTKLAFLDRGFYKSLKLKNKNIFYLKLDTPISSNTNYVASEKSIGIIGNQNNDKHSFYNCLSAIKLSKKYKVKLYRPNHITKEFLKTFSIECKIVNAREKLIKENVINLYVNFTDNNNLEFIKSMDNGIPCILGNNEIIDKNSKLSDYLVVKSDDNIDEIASKIDQIPKIKDDILKEYKKFREEYSVCVEKLKNTFLETKNYGLYEPKYEKLITIVVPVYNVEKYLASTLDSIIIAAPLNSEILIINDGSKDNSENIILEYMNNYPKLIRYIKQSNHGLGNVRNVALKEARGKYIASIDSDDTINSSFFDDAIPYLEKDIDIVIYDWLTINEDGKFATQALDGVFRNLNSYEGLLYTTIMPSTCNKIVKKSLYEKLNIKFVEDKFEDLSANPFIMLTAETIKYIDKPYYEYYIRKDSIMRSKPGLSMINIIKEVNNRLKKYKDYLNIDIDLFKYYTFSWRLEEFVFNQLYTIDVEEIDNYLSYINDNICDIIKEIFTNKEYINMLEKLKNHKLKEYIISRNKNFMNGNLSKFIKNARKENKYYKLTPPIIYYGD